MGDRNLVLEPSAYLSDGEIASPDSLMLVVNGNGEVGGVLMKKNGGTVFSRATKIAPSVVHASRGIGSILAIKTAGVSTI